MELSSVVVAAPVALGPAVVGARISLGSVMLDQEGVADDDTFAGIDILFGDEDWVFAD